MTNEEVAALPGANNPVLCTDGKLGMLLIRPDAEGACGVQVRGEDEHRWIAAADLTAGKGGALRQAGAPMAPLTSMVVAEPGEAAQALLALDWACCGGVPE